MYIIKEIINTIIVLIVLSAILWAIMEYSRFEYVLLTVFVLLSLFGIAIIFKPLIKGRK